jgi:type VII secretion-associated serine protease mycosin
MRVTEQGAVVAVRSSTGPAAVTGMIAAAQSDPAVVAVEVDHRVQASGVVTRSLDTYRDQQWALDRLDAENAWQSSRGAGVVVGVVDSGVDGTHPDLVGQVLTGTDLVSPGGNGWNDQNGHGTHVAGIVAALAGNGIGVAGLAPGAKILPVRALDADGGGWDSDVAQGVIWAADHGATVINLSLGSPDASDADRSAIVYAIGKGAVVLAAAGNERTAGNPVEYPAAWRIPGLLAVAATTAADASASYSNSGSYVDVAAPGDLIVSTVPGGSYASMSGTSMATPYAAATAALVRAAAPSLTPAAVASALTASAADLEATGRDADTGAGLVDPVDALCDVSHCPPGATWSPRATGSGTPTTTSTTTTSPTTTSPSTTTNTTGGSPSTSPTPGPGDTEMGISLDRSAGAVTAGRPAIVTATVLDADGPVAGATVSADAAGRRVQGLTDGDGIVVLRLPVIRTAVWKIVATAGGHRVTTAGLPVPVVPAVGVRWSSGRVAVTVAPATGQLITAWRAGSHGWVVVRRARLGGAVSGTAVLAVPRSGRVKVTVGAVTGLGAVTVTRH